MKFLMIIASVLVISCNSGKNSGNDDKDKESTTTNKSTSDNRWSNEDQVNFMNDCISEAGKNMKGDSAQVYCACMLTKAQAAYPVFDDVSKKMTVDQVDKWAAECLGK